jgi:dipeptidyl aminopeptidase/acylaminoacyl peptidase
VFGVRTLDEVRAIVKQMSLENIAEKITCPLLIVHGENDRQIPLWHAEKTYAQAINSPDRELKIFRLADGGAEHCGADNNGLIVDYITDWVAERLGASPQGL